MSEILVANGKVEIFQKEGILYYSLKYDNREISELTSVVFVELDGKLHHLFPKMSFNRKLQHNKFDDGIGSGEIIIISGSFIDLKTSAIDPVIGHLEFKVYQHLKGETLYSTNYPFLSIQIFIDKIKSPQEYNLYGYAPIYAKNNGLLKLNDIINPKFLSFYSNGWQSWSHNHLNFHREKTPKIPTWLQFFRLLKVMHENHDETLPDRYFSEMHTVISDTNNLNSLIISFVTHKNQFNRILMEDLGNGGAIKWLCALSQTDSIPIANLKEELLQSEIVMMSLVSKPEAYEVLTHLQEVTGLLANIRTTSKSEVGWCSWYYYYEDINEKEMISNLEFFENHKDVPIDLIQLDDGYQTAIGDWGFYNNKFNEKFPQGLEWLSKRIQKGNFNSGLWVAPFLAIESSNILKEYPEWMIRDSNGELIKAIDNWREMNYSIDPSNPEVEQYIHDLASKISNDWNFDYLKIDFIYSAAIYGSHYHDRNLTRAQVYRKGLEAIRKGFGEEKVILGCGAPLGPAVGVVDAMRIGEDTAAVWSVMEKIAKKVSGLENIALKPALRATVQRSYMHNTLFVNDPDCVVVRQNKSKLSMDEIILQLTIFGLSGGAILISDDEKLVDQDRMDLLKRILPPYSPVKGDPDFVLPAANPLDIFSRKLPRLYSKNIRTGLGNKHLVAVINWKNKPRTFSYHVKDLMDYKNRIYYNKNQKFMVYDYWNEKPISISCLDDIIKLPNISKHGCLYIIISPLFDEELSFINSTLHLIPGGPDISSLEVVDSELKIVIKKISEREGTITLYSKKWKSLKTEEFETTSEKFGEGYILSIHLTTIPRNIISIDLE